MTRFLETKDLKLNYDGSCPAKIWPRYYLEIPTFRFRINLVNLPLSLSLGMRANYMKAFGESPLILLPWKISLPNNTII
jgi:hypothetical protein